MSTSSEQMSVSPDAMSASPSPSPPPRPSTDGRQLPSIPSSVPYNAGPPSAAKGNSLSNNNRGSNGYGPFFQEYSLLAEYNQLHQQKIPGLYVMPCAKTPLVWSGLLFIRQGLYQGGAFRFTLTIPDNYPDGDCPKFVFEYPVFHPLIHPETGEVDIKRAFPRWRKNVNHLWQVFLYVKKIFYKLEVKSPSNPEAATLYDQEMEMFKNRVSDSLKEAKDRLLQPPNLEDPFALRFSPWNEAVHPDTRRQMINSSQRQSSDAGSANPSDLGLSWMEAGQTKIFSRDDASSA
ncbi:AKT-interacting protein isoform X2 [Aplysia californica]|uniref:AKT-interacting protein isoform X2 n=1 Tax=Aplysia californica TaxID=6500 RepID=A0ABM1VYH3_APLCA|nr:AKT-interacting protein isoform X2 [Aplysia californica]